jgi:hypothetical protein
MRRLLVLTSLLALPRALLALDDPAPPAVATTEEDQRAKLQKELEASIQWNEFKPTADGESRMEAHPVHRWTNNERDPFGQGIAVLWTDRGRPSAIASIYPWGGQLIHELESISRGPFVCHRDGVEVWAPTQGNEFRPVPGAPVPDEAAFSRLRQMKQIADRFQVTMLGWKDDNSDRELLRRLPKELYRMKALSDDCLDAAMFGYVKGTDPEAVLILDAVRVGGAYQWQYAFARQTSGGVEARIDDSIVWTVEKHIARRDPSQSFISLSGPLVTQVDGEAGR